MATKLTKDIIAEGNAAVTDECIYNRMGSGVFLLPLNGVIKPFAFIKDAIGAAFAGDTVLLNFISSNEDDIALKDKVNIHSNNSVIINSAANGNPIFHNLSGSSVVDCIISGNLLIKKDVSNVPAVVLGYAFSNIVMRGYFDIESVASTTGDLLVGCNFSGDLIRTRSNNIASSSYGINVPSGKVNIISNPGYETVIVQNNGDLQYMGGKLNKTTIKTSGGTFTCGNTWLNSAEFINADTVLSDVYVTDYGTAWSAPLYQQNGSLKADGIRVHCITTPQSNIGFEQNGGNSYLSTFIAINPAQWSINVYGGGNCYSYNVPYGAASFNGAINLNAGVVDGNVR